MDAIKIKYQNQICHIIAQTCHFYDFLKQLEIKLKNDFFYKNGHFEAFFSFPYTLGVEECSSLYHLCDLYHTIILGFHLPEEETSMQLVENNFYVGETYRLTQDTVYIGNIDKDVFITSTHNIYVVGEVKGQIDLLYPNLELSASSFSNAKVRVYDSKFQNVTNNAPCKVYYEEGKIKQS